MNDAEYRRLFEAEEGSWWFMGMRCITGKLIEESLSRAGIKPGRLKVLDVGCGTGFNLVFLGRYGDCVGVDPSEIALSFCKKRGVHAIRGGAEKLFFKNNSFQVVTCFDVLYHKNVASPKKALLEFRRVLKKGGVLFIREPAFRFLASEHDRAVWGARRFNLQELKGMLVDSGFNVNRATYANFLLFAPIALIRLAKNVLSVILGNEKEPETQIGVPNRVVNSALYFVMLLECALIQFVDLPFGTSVVLVARKS